jgi:2-amino-4-hydroxy-6-hydroxymethyldihydropteridine diphosphokinase
MEDEDLKIPHPFIPQRRFTLVPLVEIIPQFIHPQIHKSQMDLLNDCEDKSDVRRLGE